MPEINEEQANALIASYRSDVDRYRDRARSFATLLATAAGALAAGLIFSLVGQSFASITKITGYIGVMLLSVSICFFLSGSVFHLKKEPEQTPARRLSTKQLLDVSTADAKSAVDAISRRIKWGSRIAIVALLALIAMLPLGAAFPDDPVQVAVQLVEPTALELTSCPGANGQIRGMVTPKDLSGSSALIPIRVDEQCSDGDGPDTSVLYLNRNNVLISVLEAR